MILPSKHSRLTLLAVLGAGLAVPAAANAAVTSSVAGTTLSVASDDAGDTITIGEAGAVLTVNGVATTAAADSTFAVAIAAGGGDDTTAFTTSSLRGATIDGGAGNDTLNGSTLDDTITGGDGNDRVVAARGADTMLGGNGNDVLVWNQGEGSDRMDGEAGADEVEVNGGNGGETFTYGPGAGGRVDFRRTSAGAFSLDIGTSERLTLNALGGDDVVTGAAGVAPLILATLNGGLGADTLTGGDGADLITGGDDNDVLNGGGGDDRIAGDRGGDTLAGAAGDDTLVWNNGDGTDVMDGQDGFDRIEVNGSVGAAGDAFTAAPNGTRVNFQRTNLVPFGLNVGSSEVLELNTLGGDDTIGLANGLGGLIGVVADGGAGNDTITGADGAEVLLGGSGNDTLTGNGSSDLLDGQDGNDLLLARDGGADLVRGGAGADRAVTDALGTDSVSDVESVDATATPLPSPRPVALASVASRTAPVRKGVASVKLSCAGDACTGVATLVTARSVRLGRVKARLVLGSVPYSLKAGQTRTVRVKLAPGAARLATRRSLAAVVQGAGRHARVKLTFK